MPALNKSGFKALRRFRQSGIQERCELCATPLAEPHPHLLEHARERVLCACHPCAVLFSHREEGSKFARIPDRPRRLPDFQMSDADWSSLMLPIDLAFFLNRSSTGHVVACYPSPAGITESQLTLNYWDELVEQNQELQRMQPDVEALLVNRTRGSRECYIAPIDECYRLTGLIRVYWRGLSGGDAVWGHIDQFFGHLAFRSERSGARANA
jgi:hypothetical protein